MDFAWQQSELLSLYCAWQAAVEGAVSTSEKLASSVADAAGTLSQAVASLGKVGARDVVIKDLTKEAAKAM